MLGAIWSHSTLSRTQKVRIFSACVVAKLTYALFAACLNQAERRRIDGFQAQCLRKIYRVPPSYISTAGQLPLSEQICKQQMLFMGKLARRPGTDPVRLSVFEPDSFDLRAPSGPRKRGRPRQSWGNMVMNNCLRVAGTPARLAAYFRPEGGAARAWASAVQSWRTQCIFPPLLAHRLVQGF